MKFLILTFSICIFTLTQAIGSEQLVKNGDFTIISKAKSTHISNWKTKSSHNKAEFKLVKENKNNALCMTILDRNQKGVGIDIYQRNIPLKINQYYNFNLALKKLSGKVQVCVMVQKNKKWKSIFFERINLSNDKWERFSFTFKASQTEKACIRIRLNTHVFSNASILVDDISLVSCANPVAKDILCKLKISKSMKINGSILKHPWKQTTTRSAIPISTWKFKPLYKTKNNPDNDIGTINKFHIPNYDDSRWSNYKTTAFENNRSKRESRVEWYRTTFTPSKISKDQRQLLVFDCLGTSNAKIYLNGKLIAKHYSRIVPLVLDITEKLIPGQNNIALRIFAQIGKRTKAEPGLSGQVWLKVVPDIKFTNIMVSPRLDMQGLIINTKITKKRMDMKKAKLRCYVWPWSKSSPNYSTTCGEIIVDLTQEVETKHLFFLNIIKPELWCPQNPFLYNLTLELLDNNNRVIDSQTVRFGYRQFLAKNGKFYLNGKPFLLTGVVWGGINREVNKLYRLKNGQYFRTYLEMLKQNNINHTRTHTDPWPKRMLKIADEVGFLIILEDINAPRRGFHEKRALKQLAETVRLYYNHPSIIMWDFGNELWQTYHNYTPYLCKAYTQTRKIDVSQRPILSSSGRGSHGIMEGLAQPTDVIAIHKYIGQSNGAWHLLGESLERYYKKYNITTQKNKLKQKTICLFENFGLMSHKKHQEQLCPFCLDRDYILYQPLPNKKVNLRGVIFNPSNINEFVKATRIFNSESSQSFTQRCFSIIGGRLVENGCAEQHIMAAEGKELIEEWRRKCNIIPGYEALPAQLRYNTLLNSGARGLYNEPLRPQPLLSECYRIVFSPWFVCTNIFDKNHFAGSSINLKLYAMNNSNSDAKEHLNVLMRIFSTRGNKKLFFKKWVKFKALEIDTRQTKDLALKLPLDLPTGIYRLDLTMYQGDFKDTSNNRKIYKYPLSTNWYYFYSLNPRDQLKKIACDNKTVAIYGCSKKLIKIIQSLGIKFCNINNLSKLNNFQFLIIGQKKDFNQLQLYARSLRQWLDKGGQLLALNLPTGNVPWDKKYQIVKNGGVSKLHLVKSNHPLFQGLLPFNFKHWNTSSKHKYIGNTLISPIDTNVIGAGSEKISNKTMTSVGEYNLGKGKFVLSQLNAISKYNIDSSATRYFNNLLAYFIKTKVKPFKMLPLTPLTQAELIKSSQKRPDKQGFIRNWLVMGPFPNPGSRITGIYQGFKTDYLKPLGGELNIKPQIGQKFSFYNKSLQNNDLAEGQILTWKKLNTSGSQINFLNFFGGSFNVAYATCYINMPQTRKVKISIGSDDGCKVYLNHKLVINEPKHRNAKPDQNQADVVLKKGLNLLLVKIDNSVNGWKFYLRLLDSTGKPVTNYTIDI